MADQTVAARARLSMQILLSEDDWAEHLREETLAGLRLRPPTTPAVWFYDGVGSDLFDQITRLDEYYPTRAERAILELNGPEIAKLGRASSLVELGAGSADKTRLLLQALSDDGTLERYVPIDCSEAALVDAAERVMLEFPHLTVEAIVADFNAHLPHLPRSSGRMLAFLGSTVGNFTNSQRSAFFSEVAGHLSVGDSFLLGTDLVKSEDRLVAAYNDTGGVTAAFNLNSLSVMNRQLGANFDPGGFTHEAVWNQPERRIEMRLVARHTQRVVFAELDHHEIEFSEHEWLRTEISVKFTPPQVCDELAAAGLRVLGQWTDPDGDFLLTLAAPVHREP